MVIDTSVPDTRSEIAPLSATRSLLLSSCKSERPLVPDPVSNARVVDDRDVAKPFLADWARDHPWVREASRRSAAAATDSRSTGTSAYPIDPSGSGSEALRQLELRAIFGTDRELGEGEILQRSRRLPGVQHLVRVADQEIEAMDTARRALGNLGFAGGPVNFACVEMPVHFIHKGKVRLLVQVSGGFAPGVRETLMIVAEELDRL